MLLSNPDLGRPYGAHGRIPRPDTPVRDTTYLGSPDLSSRRMPSRLSSPTFPNWLGDASTDAGTLRGRTSSHSTARIARQSSRASLLRQGQEEAGCRVVRSDEHGRLIPVAVRPWTVGKASTSVRPERHVWQDRTTECQQWGSQRPASRAGTPLAAAERTSSPLADSTRPPSGTKGLGIPATLGAMDSFAPLVGKSQYHTRHMSDRVTLASQGSNPQSFGSANSIVSSSALAIERRSQELIRAKLMRDSMVSAAYRHQTI